MPSRMRSRAASPERSAWLFNTAVPDEQNALRLRADKGKYDDDAGVNRMDLALFDFDGTITVDPTYPAFVRSAVRPGRKLFGGIILTPLILGYRIGLLSDRRVRGAISRVAFWREDPRRLRVLGADFARNVLPPLVGPEAVERIEWHKSRGDRVVVVSAALDVYIEPWCEAMGVEAICTRLEVTDDRVTGRYVGDDCCGREGEKGSRATQGDRLH